MSISYLHGIESVMKFLVHNQSFSGMQWISCLKDSLKVLKVLHLNRLKVTVIIHGIVFL